MKTMKKLGTYVNPIVRVPENRVQDYLNDGYQFCPKHEWKDLKRETKQLVKELTQQHDAAKSGSQRNP